MEQLPDYMKICYLSLFNTTNEMAYHILKQQGINVLPYLTKQVKLQSSLLLFSIFEAQPIMDSEFNYNTKLISSNIGLCPKSFILFDTSYF